VGVLHTFESSIVVDTRITSRKENLVCQASTAVDEPGTTCPVVYNTTGEETTNYGSNIGLFTVLFDTSVTATSLGITGQSADMEGWLCVLRASEHTTGEAREGAAAATSCWASAKKRGEREEEGRARRRGASAKKRGEREEEGRARRRGPSAKKRAEREEEGRARRRGPSAKKRGEREGEGRARRRGCCC
jgi:hypothetical protein